MDEFLVGLLATGGGVFAASAASKLRGRQAFRDFRTALGALRLLSGRSLSGAAFALATAEAVIACALTAADSLIIAGAREGYRLAEAGLASGVCLTAMLAAGVALVIRRGTRAPCRCFGGGTARPLGPAHLIRNCVLLVLLLAGLAGCGVSHARPGPAGTVLAAVIGLIAALLVARWDDLAILLSPGQPT